MRGHLEGRQSLPDPGTQLFGVELLAGPRDDEGLDLLAQLLVVERAVLLCTDGVIEPETTATNRVWLTPRDADRVRQALIMR